MFRKKIRKDVGDLLLEDLELYPSWEYCLAEEGHAEQTECTVRPFKRRSATLQTSDYCLLACDLFANKGTQLFGWVQMGGDEQTHPWDFSPEILLESFPKEITEAAEYGSIPYVLLQCSGTARISLCLGKTKPGSDEKYRPKLDLAYRILGIAPNELFPIEITPRQTVSNWPKPFVVDGFLRPSDEYAAESMR